MTRTRMLLMMGIVAMSGAMLPQSGEAIPAFARKYGYNCTMCHSSFPRLNDYGERYRQNAYQLPGRENEEKTVLEGPPPFAVRLSGGYTSYSAQNSPDIQEQEEFLMNGVDVLSSGLLAPNIGYFVTLLPQIDESRGVEAQDGTLESGNVMFSNLGSPWLNVRVGRMEPASSAFSVKRKLSITPYEVYSFGAPGVATLADTQDGIEATGHGRGLAYAVGYLNGSENNRADDAPQDVYARASVVLGAGEGQTAGQRLGVIGYLGQTRPGTDEADGTGDRQDLSRVGFDASLNAMHSNLALQYLVGEDDQLLWGTTEDVEFSGGFAELSVMPCTWIVGFGRFDWVDTPSDIDQDITRWTGGARYYFVDNLALHVEYSHRRQHQPDAPVATEDFAAARLDLAF
ncbi:MAG: hypothetical protein K8T26_10310 [Lentisphaerae bacterium]|nr:hypothetical protein [Lentisphaerota bacterium]